MLSTHNPLVLPDGSYGKKRRLVSWYNENIKNSEIATWNLQRLGQNEQELNKQLKEKNVNIAVITESKETYNLTIDLVDFVMNHSV